MVASVAGRLLANKKAKSLAENIIANDFNNDFATRKVTKFGGGKKGKKGKKGRKAKASKGSSSSSSKQRKRGAASENAGSADTGFDDGGGGDGGSGGGGGGGATTASNKRRGKPGLQMYAGAVESAGSKAKHFAATLPRKLMAFKDFLVAMLILVVVVLVLAVLYVFFWHSHPRLCSINRSAEFEKYMDKFGLDVQNHVFHMRDLLESGQATLLFRASAADVQNVLRCDDGTRSRVEFPPAAANTTARCALPVSDTELLELLRKLTSRGRETFDENINLYYRFYTTIRRLDRPIYSFFARRDILHADRFNQKDSETGEPKEVVDEGAVKRFEEDFMQPMDRLREVTRRLSNEMAAWQGLYHQPWYTNAMFDFVTGVHMLNLMLNEYHDQITSSYDTRKALAFTMQFNVWTLYYVPYAEKTFTVRIPAIWKRFPDRFTSQYQLFMDGWEKLGKLFSNLGLRLARSTNHDTFQQQEQRDKTDNDHADDDDGDKEEEDVVEGLGFLKGLLSVGEFFLNVLEVAIVIARVVAKFVSDPVGATLDLVFIILATILGLILTLIHTMLTLLGVNYILAVVWGWLVAFTLSLLLTVVEVVFVAIMTVVFAVLWLLDLLTGGLVVKLMRCENLPDEWENRANHAEGNTALRVFGMLCCYPCPSRFKPWGAVCQRLPTYIPDHCPHQQIIRTFRNGKPAGGGAFGAPVMFDTFPARADPALLTKPREEKEKVLLAAFERGRGFLGTCYRAYEKYDYVNRHVCNNVDRLPDGEYPAEVKATLRALCSQTYCEYVPRKRGFRDYVADLVRKPEDAGQAPSCLCKNIAAGPTPAPANDTDATPPPAVQTSWTLLRKGLLILLVFLFALIAVYSLTDVAAVLFGQPPSASSSSSRSYD